MKVVVHPATRAVITSLVPALTGLRTLLRSARELVVAVALMPVSYTHLTLPTNREV